MSHNNSVADRLGSGATSSRHKDGGVSQDTSPQGARFRDKNKFGPLPEWKVGGVTMTGALSGGVGNTDISQIVKNKDIFEKML